MTDKCPRCDLEHVQHGPFPSLFECYEALRGEVERLKSECLAAIDAKRVAAEEGQLDRDRLQEVKREAFRLRGALEQVEWTGLRTGVGEQTGGYCPWCRGAHFEGHAPDCPRVTLLKKGD